MWSAPSGGHHASNARGTEKQRFLLIGVASASFAREGNRAPPYGRHAARQGLGIRVRVLAARARTGFTLLPGLYVYVSMWMSAFRPSQPCDTAFNGKRSAGARLSRAVLRTPNRTYELRADSRLARGAIKPYSVPPPPRASDGQCCSSAYITVPLCIDQL